MATRTKTRERGTEESPLFAAPEQQKPVTATVAPDGKPPTRREQPPTGTAVVAAEPRRGNLLSAILSATKDPDCQPDKIDTLVSIVLRLMNQQAQVQYRKAYREAQAQMPRIDKDGKIDEGRTNSGKIGKKTRFATYENLNKKIGPILKKVGLDLSLRSEPKPSGDGVLMTATLSYIADTEYGEIVYAESSIVPMPPDPTGSKNAAQAVSSGLAYAKRNAVILVLNIVSEAPEDRDIDGNAPKAGKPTTTAAAVEDNRKAAHPEEAEAHGGEPKITESEAADLRDAIEDSGLQVNRFCEKYNIRTVGELPATLLPEATSALKNYKLAASRGR